MSTADSFGCYASIRDLENVKLYLWGSGPFVTFLAYFELQYLFKIVTWLLLIVENSRSKNIE